jgi:hypothetical protein
MQRGKRGRHVRGGKKIRDLSDRDLTTWETLAKDFENAGMREGEGISSASSAASGRGFFAVPES